MTPEMEMTAARILGDWAMMLVEPETAEVATQILETDSDLFSAGLEFRGIVSGRYIIICPRTFAILIAQNLLGGEEIGNEDEILDALKEMVNVFGGNLLTATYGTDEVFALTCPEAKIISKDEVRKLCEKKVIWLRGDGEPVGVAFIPEIVRV